VFFFVIFFSVIPVLNVAPPTCHMFLNLLVACHGKDLRQILLSCCSFRVLMS